MAIEIKEFLGSQAYKINSVNNSIIDFKENANTSISNKSIMELIEGIHVGPTRNYTWYTAEALRNSIPTWTSPYKRPLILFHNEDDGKIIGRVTQVEYKEENTRSNTPALEFVCNIADEEAIEQVQNGILSTVSIGVIVHEATCSICGEPLILDDNGESTCGHTRGEEYDDKICYWMIQKMEAKELSYVIVPSDIYAHNIKTLTTTGNIQLKEKMNESGGINKMSNIANVNTNNFKDNVVDVNTQPVKIDPESQKQNPEPNVGEDNKVQEEIKQENERLKEEVEKLKQLLADKKEKGITDEGNKELEEAKLELQKAKDKLLEIENKLKVETNLKESLENDVVSIKKELRESLEENILSLRTVCKKPIITKESLKNRSNDSLKDSILDLKAELKEQSMTASSNISIATDPTIKKQKDKKNNVTNVKESFGDSNNVIESELKDIMSSLMDGYKY